MFEALKKLCEEILERENQKYVEEKLKKKLI